MAFFLVALIWHLALSLGFATIDSGMRLTQNEVAIENVLWGNVPRATLQVLAWDTDSGLSSALRDPRTLGLCEYFCGIGRTYDTALRNGRRAQFFDKLISDDHDI